MPSHWRGVPAQSWDDDSVNSHPSGSPSVTLAGLPPVSLSFLRVESSSPGRGSFSAPVNGGVKDGKHTNYGAESEPHRLLTSGCPLDGCQAGRKGPVSIWAHPPRATHPGHPDPWRARDAIVRFLSRVPRFLRCGRAQELAPLLAMKAVMGDWPGGRRGEPCRSGGAPGRPGPWEEEWRQLWPQSLSHQQRCSLPRCPHPDPSVSSESREGLKLSGALGAPLSLEKPAGRSLSTEKP